MAQSETLNWPAGLASTHAPACIANQISYTDNNLNSRSVARYSYIVELGQLATVL